jgi:hypothetical protein
LRHPRTEAPHQRRELADPRRQQRLDAFAQTPRQNGRCAASADRDDDVAAIDDGREDESREFRTIDDVDGHAVSARPRSDIGVPQLAGSAHDGNEVGEIRATRIVGTDFQQAGLHIGGELTGIEFVSVPPHVSARGLQQS